MHENFHAKIICIIEIIEIIVVISLKIVTHRLGNILEITFKILQG